MAGITKTELAGLSDNVFGAGGVARGTLENVDPTTGRNALAAAANATGANFAAGFTGAVSRTTKARVESQSVNMLDFHSGGSDYRPALQAAVDYAKTIGEYFRGGSIRVQLPSGTYNFTSTHPTKTDRVIDTTACSNVEIIGVGVGATRLNFTGNVSLFRNDDIYTAPVSALTYSNFTITGPYLAATAPLANGGSKGIYLKAGNGCLVHFVRIYACAVGLEWLDCFNCEFIQNRIIGLGDLACRRGYSALDGTLALTENAVGIIGGRIYGCTEVGFRGECLTGSLIVDLEILGCTTAAFYLGDSPGGKDLKWINVRNCVLDSSGSLLLVRRGTSAVAELVHFSGMWLGFGSAGSSVGVEFSGMQDSSLNAEVIANTQFAANIANCQRVSFRAGIIQDYDRESTGGVAIICNNTTHSRFDVGSAAALPGSPSATAFVEQGTSNYNLITGLFDNAVTVIGANSNKTLTIVY